MKNKKIEIILISYLVFSFIFQPILFTTINTPNDHRNEGNLRTSAVVSGTKQWLNDSGFDSPISDWYSESNGDNTDVTASIGGGVANFTINGEENQFNNISGIPQDGEWTPGNESEISINPDNYGIDSDYGCWADHEYNEGGDQSRNNPIIQWNRNITMPIDMSDYLITSGELVSIFNGSADLNIETPFESIEGDGGSPPTGYAAEYDHTRFYVLISDLEKIEQYEIAYNQTVELGRGYWGRTGQSNPIENNVTDTEMTQIDEEDLVFFLNRVLEKDNSDFTITLGIDIYNEDNYASGERDRWNYLYIKTCNFTFNYTKKIDQFTSVSWKQDGQKISNISSYPVDATGAKLNFQYRLDKNWSTTTLDQNSEINIYLNGIPYAIPIKLSEVNSTSFEEVTIELAPPSDSVNFTIELLLRESFILNQSISFLFDNVSLEISYQIFEPAAPSGGGGGGGSRTIIRGTDYTPLVISLVAGIIALVAIFTAYQKHYKYPPMVRKIKKIKKKIKKGKGIKSLVVKSRENIVSGNFRKQIKMLEEEKVPSKQKGPTIKTTKNEKEDG